MKKGLQDEQNGERITNIISRLCGTLVSQFDYVVDVEPSLYISKSRPLRLNETESIQLQRKVITNPDFDKFVKYTFNSDCASHNRAAARTFGGTSASHAHSLVT